MEKTYYQAPTAAVLGDVELEDGVSVWFSSVVRGDENRIQIGRQTNIQENCTVHVEEGHPVIMGERVTVGHNTILHGCTIGDESMIGMGSIIMNGAQIGTHCFIGAGSLVTEGTVIPDGSLAFGRPAKVVRRVTDEEIQHIKESSQYYVDTAQNHLIEKKRHNPN